jgi:hypothetical protein
LIWFFYIIKLIFECIEINTQVYRNQYTRKSFKLLIYQPYLYFYNSLSSHSIYKGYAPHKVRVVFFENTTQKISTLSPLSSAFWQVWDCRQAEHTQNENLRNLACSDYCTCQIASTSVLKKILLLYSITLCGASPKPQPSTTPKQEKPILRRFMLFFSCYGKITNENTEEE